MDPMEKIIADAMCRIDRNAALRRIDCNLAARTLITCICGEVLDQDTVTIIKAIKGDRIVAAYCPRCLPRAYRLWGGYTAVTWNEEFILE